VAKKNSGSEYITDTCLLAIEYILSKKGEIKLLGDKDVISD
jgi:hypothetical protein